MGKRFGDTVLSGKAAPDAVSDTELHKVSSSCGIFPLTQSQEGLWYGQHLDSGNPIYNTGEYIEICGELDIIRFASAVNQVMAESQAMALQLAANTLQGEAGPVQWINSKHIPVLEVIDLRKEECPAATAIAAIHTDMNTPLDLATGQLAVQRLYRLRDMHYYWYERIHHLLVDGWGQSLINTHVAALYRGDAEREPLTPYQVWLDDDAAYKGSEREKSDFEFWKSVFVQAPVVADLSLGHGAVPITSHTAIRLEEPMPTAFEQALLTLCRDENQSWPDVLTALTAAYICRHTTADETVIGVPYMGRMGQACARVPATVMNVLPLRVQVNAQQPLPDFLMDVVRSLRKIRRHGRYRSEQLRRDLGLLGGHKRLYGPTVNVLPFDCAQLELPGLQTIRHPLGNGPVEDLTVTFRADALGRNMRMEIDANPARYTEHDVQVHVQRLQKFLMLALQASRLSDIPLLTEKETYQWVYACNDTDKNVPQTTLMHLMASSWQSTPDAIALEFEGEQLTYAQLDAQTAQLAQRLYNAGVRRTDIVAVAIPRSLELVVALVSVLRAGAAYLPLDVDYPAQRIAMIIASAKPKLALITESAHHLMPAELTSWVFQIESAQANSQITGKNHLPELPGPFDAAYVIFTSGSTGAPKGVVIEHDAIVNRLLWMQAHYGIHAQDRILQKTPATFDVSVWEFFLPLITGATLVIAPPTAHKDPQHLAQIMREANITTLHFVPSMLSVFLAQHQLFDAEDAFRFTALKRVFCSGEALPAELRDQFHATIGGPGGAELHNLYGPTEAAVDVSYWAAGFNDHSSPVPIGFPVWNTQLYVLDKNQHPVPPGVAGYLYLAGRQLARGYLGRDDLTQERFVVNPFIKGERMYATGDLARWREDGSVVFLGRSDFQIKIRGQRVELEEIETVVARTAGVAQAAVIVRQDQLQDPRIVAYVVSDPAHSLGQDELRQAAVAHLPDYMVPSAFVLLPQLPVTSNGKLDRTALPAPVFVDHAGEPLKPGTQTQLAALFASVLKRQTPIYANDDFFALGGHSLLAAELMLDIRAQWGYAIGLGTLFEHPTVSQLSAYLDNLGGRKSHMVQNMHQHPGREGFGPEIMLRMQTLRHTGKCPALFCIHPAGGISWCYGALARNLATDRDVVGIQSPGLDMNAPLPQTLQAMAISYVDTLLQKQPCGPYHLLGWSIGGIIAQAMAVELQRRHLPVGIVALLDAYPSDCWRHEKELPESAAYKALLHIAGHDPDRLNNLELTRNSVIAFLRRSGHPLGYLTDAMLQGIIRVVDANNRLVRQHEHTYFDGDVLYFRAALDHAGKELHPTQWAPYVKHIHVTDVPSLHAHLVGADMVKMIVPVLDRAMLRSDRHL